MCRGCHRVPTHFYIRAWNLPAFCIRAWKFHFRISGQAYKNADGNPEISRFPSVFTLFRCLRLFADAEFFLRDDRTISVDVLAYEVVEK